MPPGGETSWIRLCLSAGREPWVIRRYNGTCRLVRRKEQRRGLVGDESYSCNNSFRYRQLPLMGVRLDTSSQNNQDSGFKLALKQKMNYPSLKFLWYSWYGGPGGRGISGRDYNQDYHAYGFSGVLCDSYWKDIPRNHYSLEFKLISCTKQMTLLKVYR